MTTANSGNGEENAFRFLAIFFTYFAKGAHRFTETQLLSVFLTNSW